MQLLAKDLAKWATQGAKFIGNLFVQRALTDAFQGMICFAEKNRCYGVSTDDRGVEVVNDLTQGLRMARKIRAHREAIVEGNLHVLRQLRKRHASWWG